MKRREVYRLLLGLSGLACGALSVCPAQALGRPATTTLERRLELWRVYARRNQRLVARYRSTRRTALLVEPLYQSGTLLFEAPDRLVLRDDTIDGSTTHIDASAARIVPNRSGGDHEVVLDADRDSPALRWMLSKTLALFAPGDGATLERAASLRAPRSRVPTLEIRPLKKRDIRVRLRALIVTLDPASGAISSILVQESQGDEFRVELSDHRQDVSAADFQQLVDE